MQLDIHAGFEHCYGPATRQLVAELHEKYPFFYTIKGRQGPSDLLMEKIRKLFFSIREQINSKGSAQFSPTPPLFAHEYRVMQSWLEPYGIQLSDEKSSVYKTNQVVEFRVAFIQKFKEFGKKVQ